MKHGSDRRKSKLAVKSALAMNRKPWICDACGTATVQIPGDDSDPCQHDINGEGCSCESIKFHRRRIFSLSLGDWLDDEVPIEWFAEMLDTIRKCDQVIWILLTKRPENFYPLMQSLIRLGGESFHVAREVAGLWLDGKPPENVWFGVSVEDQQRADERIQEMLKIPAKVRWLSVEPLLGPVDLLRPAFDGSESFSAMGGIKWVVVGGESGPNARPCNVEWIRGIVRQCATAEVPCFVKQLGKWVDIDDDPDPGFARTSQNDKDGRWYAELSHPKGGDTSEWPEDLRVRQYPN